MPNKTDAQIEEEINAFSSLLKKVNTIISAYKGKKITLENAKVALKKIKNSSNKND